MSSALPQKPLNSPRAGLIPDGAATPPPSDPMLNVLAWVEVNRSRLVAGLVAFIALVGVGYLWRHLAAEREAAANAALLSVRAKPNQPDSAPKPAEYIAVAEKHSSSGVADRARLIAAGALFTDNKYAEAQAQFEKVLASVGSGPLAAQAEFGIAASLDALDKADAALAKYQEVISKYPDDSAAGQARFALARLQEARKQPEAALRLYDELLRDKEAGPFSQQASVQRDELIRRNPQLATGGTNNAPAKAGK